MVFCRYALLAESYFAAPVLCVSLGCSFKGMLSLMSSEANMAETINPLIFQCYIKTLTNFKWSFHAEDEKDWSLMVSAKWYAPSSSGTQVRKISNAVLAHMPPVPPCAGRFSSAGHAALTCATKMSLGAASLGWCPWWDAFMRGWQEEWCLRNNFTGQTQQQFKCCIILSLHLATKSVEVPDEDDVTK